MGGRYYIKPAMGLVANPTLSAGTPAQIENALGREFCAYL